MVITLTCFWQLVITVVDGVAVCYNKPDKQNKPDALFCFRVSLLEYDEINHSPKERGNSRC